MKHTTTLPNNFSNREQLQDLLNKLHICDKLKINEIIKHHKNELCKILIMLVKFVYENMQKYNNSYPRDVEKLFEHTKKFCNQTFKNIPLITTSVDLADVSEFELYDEEEQQHLEEQFEIEVRFDLQNQTVATIYTNQMSDGTYKITYDIYRSVL